VSNKTKFQLLEPADVLVSIIGVLFVFSFLIGTSVVAASVPFPFFDPFTRSSPPQNPQLGGEICNDGQDNNGNGLVDENCSLVNESNLTKFLNELLLKQASNVCNAGQATECKQLDDLGLVNQGNKDDGKSLPESEICNDGQDNDGNGLVDENCGPVSSSGGTQSSPSSSMPEQEICGDMQDNDGNGLVDENCGPVSSGGGTQSSPSSSMPEQEICGDMQDNDGNGLVDENCSTSSLPKTAPASGNTVGSNAPNEKKSDKFGIREIYPTKLNGEEWFMGAHPEKDPRFSPQTQLISNSDGSFKVKSTKVRMGAFTSSGYKPSQISTLDHSKIAIKGYMQSPNDWRDVEITGYVKLNSGSGDNFAWYARGGRHTGFGNPEGCEGVAYKGDLYYNGQTRWTKEQWHTGGYVFGDYQKGMGPLNGKWVGFKAIMYNIQEAGKTAVKLEIWLDKNNDNQWTKVNERIDNGGWGNTDGECGGKPDQIITWGGPIASFRWDSASDVDVKNFSVREIQPNL